LHEATYIAELAEKAKETWHATTLDAARVAKEANVGQLVINHISARYEDVAPLVEECRTIFPNTIAAEDLMRITIP
jgi:ribonuclease Z